MARISQSTANQQNQVYSRQSYIVKWCFLCFLAENNDMLSEMADIQRALNQADTPSSMNTLIAVRTLIPSLLAENTLIYSS